MARNTASDEATRLSLPVAPRNVEETGLTEKFLVELLIKNLYTRGQAIGMQIADMVCLPVHLVAELMAEVKVQQCCEILGSASSHVAHFEYQLTERGQRRAHEIMERDSYRGPAPVPLSDYSEMVLHQSALGREITVDMVRQAFNGLVIGEDLLRRLGAACNSGSSLFLYGYPGNGKTIVAQRLSRMTQTPIAVPHAIDSGGEVIKFFDPSIHRRLSEGEGGLSEAEVRRFDQRWVIIQRPFVMAGGELRLEDLDVHYDNTNRQHMAALQMLANGGTFLIDDFGRQQAAPSAILNRWMVPLEQRIDYYTLGSGKQISVPFDPLLILSTNLSPAALVDEAFLRRIRYKIEIPPPTEEQYREIFRLNCAQRNLEHSDEILDYLLNYHYFEMRRELRACHPRDLLAQCIALASFEGIEPKLTRQLIDEACKTYFIDL